MENSFKDNKLLFRYHPCYSKEAHHKYYRLHLPVARNCNLGCNYCERKIGGPNYHAHRPGTTKQLLTPQEAFCKLLELNSQKKLKVVGIAGPGEPLFNKETFITLELIRNRFPDLILCLSTNGLLISKYINTLKTLKVKSVSVTINSLNIATLQKIYSYVYTSEGVYLFSTDAARYIQKKQIEGIRSIVENEITFKVNTILIPGINEYEMESLAKCLKDLGVTLQNIVPFIPLGWLKTYPGSTCHQLQNTRRKCEKYIRQFRLCKQCSSDVFNIPGMTKA